MKSAHRTLRRASPVDTEHIEPHGNDPQANIQNFKAKTYKINQSLQAIARLDAQHD